VVVSVLTLLVWAFGVSTLMLAAKVADLRDELEHRDLVDFAAEASEWGVE
jgi:hypothetical protein